jgi:hypothetical protein
MSTYYDDRKRHNPEVHEWCYRMINDPNEWEKFRYIDTINHYNRIIKECQKLYDNTPATAANRFIRAISPNAMKRAQKDLTKTQAEYDKFKKYKARTTISK